MFSLCYLLVLASGVPSFFQDMICRVYCSNLLSALNLKLFVNLFSNYLKNLKYFQHWMKYIIFCFLHLISWLHPFGCIFFKNLWDWNCSLTSVQIAHCPTATAMKIQKQQGHLLCKRIGCIHLNHAIFECLHGILFLCLSSFCRVYQY